MGESKHEYRLFGVMYVILGLCFFFFFSYITIDFQLSSHIWRIGPFGISFPVFILSMVALYGSLILVLFGFILLVRCGVWVARFSSILCIFLLFCYLLVIYSTIIVVLV